MAKKPNYRFEKRQKEVARKTKKQEKIQRKQETETENAEQPAEEEQL